MGNSRAVSAPPQLAALLAAAGPEAMESDEGVGDRGTEPAKRASAASAVIGAPEAGAGALTPLLEADEQRRSLLQSLWTEYHRDPSTLHRNALVEEYQGFIREVVRRFASRLPRSVDRGDLETAATVGLMAAVANFEPERGVPFEPYCEQRVRGALLDELRSQDWLPRPWRRRLEQYRRVRERLHSELEREPVEREIAAALNLSDQEFRQSFGHSLPHGPPLDLALDDGGDGHTFGLDVLPDSGSEPVGEELSRTELFNMITQRASDVEYRILYLRYWENLGMREIGELLQMSESRVCKVHARVIERLKDHFRVRSAD